MIPNQMKTGAVWRIDAAGLTAALQEFSFGKRKMSLAQVRAALALLQLAKQQGTDAPDDTLEDLA